MKFITYGAYVWFPVIATLSWLSTLLGLFLLWFLRDHHRNYTSKEGRVVFISDVGGAHLALFIPGCTVTFIFYSLTLISIRWLRHVDRIPGTIRKRERYWGIASMVTGSLGGFWLMMLACFNTFSHSTVHWTFTLLFILFVGASSICQTLEVIYLNQDYPHRAHLKRCVLVKLLIVSLSISFALVFGFLYASCRGKATSERCYWVISAAGVCEWLVSTFVVFYFATFILDLWPAAKSSPRHLRRKEIKSATSASTSKNTKVIIDEKKLESGVLGRNHQPLSPLPPLSNVNVNPNVNVNGDPVINTNNQNIWSGVLVKNWLKSN